MTVDNGLDQSLLRERPRLATARCCLDCETIFAPPEMACPSCGSATWHALARWLEAPPMKVMRRKMRRARIVPQAAPIRFVRQRRKVRRPLA